MHRLPERAADAKAEHERLAAILADETQREQNETMATMTRGRIASAVEKIYRRIESMQNLLGELGDVADQLTDQAEADTRATLGSLASIETNLTATIEKLAGECGLVAVEV